MVALLRAVMPAYAPSMPMPEAAGLLLGAVVLGAVVYAIVVTLLWFAARRPPGVERFVIERIRAVVDAWAARRRKVPDS
jgi:hypothetical protein